MPLKAKFTRDEIINAGLAILRKRNMSAVTAREIGNSLGSSSRPIFTVFENMGEVIEGIKQKAREIYSDYIRQGLEQDIAFKGVGKAYIRFSNENYSAILQSITDQYPVSTEDAVILYRHLWIYSHGIATLCATSMCCFSNEEIEEMLTEVFRALLIERLKERGKAI